MRVSTGNVVKLGLHKLGFDGLASKLGERGLGVVGPSLQDEVSGRFRLQRKTSATFNELELKKLMNNENASDQEDHSEQDLQPNRNSASVRCVNPRSNVPSTEKRTRLLRW